MIGALLSFALLLGPSSEQMVTIGERLINEGAYDQAIMTFKRAAQMSEEPCAPCERGMARAHLGAQRFPEAVQHMRTTIELEGGTRSEVDTILLARALMRTPGDELRPKRIGELISLLTPLAEKDDIGAMTLLADTFGRGSQDELAQQWAKKALALDPPDHFRWRLEMLRDRPYCGRERCLPNVQLTQLDQSTIESDSWVGRVVVLDFWATWCTPCIDSLPDLERLKARFEEQPFELVSISVDSDRAALDRVLDKHQLDWTQTWDPEGGLSRRRFGVQQFPTYLIVDQRGVIRTRFVGFTPNLEQRLASEVARLLTQR